MWGIYNCLTTVVVLFKSSTIKVLVDFLIDFLMCLNIFLFSLDILKLSSSGLVLIKTQSNSFFLLIFLFIFHSLDFCLCVPFHLLQLLIYSRGNRNQSSNLKHSTVFPYFLIHSAPLLILTLMILFLFLRHTD